MTLEIVIRMLLLVPLNQLQKHGQQFPQSNSGSR